MVLTSLSGLAQIMQGQGVQKVGSGHVRPVYELTFRQARGTYVILKKNNNIITFNIL